MPIKTTKEDFEIFKAECEKWIKIFGLYGWRFYYRHGNEEDAGNCIAYCVYPKKIEDRVFTIGLNENLDDYVNLTIEDIKRSAFHEIMEAFLWRIEYLAEARCPTGEDIREEKHNIVRVLESVIWGQL